MVLQRVKSTETIYLHCDPTASHYLKMLMDAVFKPKHFRNEIVWERTTGRKSVSQFGRVHDIILFYTKSGTAIWNPPTVPQTEATARGHDLMGDPDGSIYRVSDLTGAGQGPNRDFDGRTIAPPPGRHWQFDQEGIVRLLREGRIVFSKGGQPRLKTYLKDLPGVAVRDVWGDIDPINAAAGERLGYPTQKPEALLERIIQSSSNEGSVVLDPFGGCGTTIAVAQRLKRRWIGIDITHLAITLIKSRLKDAFDDSATYKVIGEPVSVPDAADLAATDPYQFQWWALGLVGARPVEQKKGADKGIDGRLYFHDEADGAKTKQIILSVKAGHVSVQHLRDLRGVLDREKAEIGVLISMEEPTKPMRAEAASAAFYTSPSNTKHARIQLLTVAELLDKGRIDYPSARLDITFKKAARVREKPKEQLALVAEDEPEYRPKKKSRSR